ncbi:MAG: hypothetical protein CO025_00990 [Ignavibacteria bacterium CG_4_9_14_0_2_um_filter_37_13]|nr:MAG: hypothetical protein CO025_00990 [Ignavibacteria bacterium CG_4_9_14_0_2_um_filter_37_13]
MKAQNMQHVYKKSILTKVFAAILVVMFATALVAQHRGDNLSFQGLSDKNEVSVKALAMGGALTAVSGDLSSLFYNPAGLSGIKQLQVSISSNYYNKQWRENQNYRPDRYFVTLPFYLEGLYIPLDSNNGKWDYQVVQDTNYNYIVQEPQLGVDPYSGEAADWMKNKSNVGLTNISAAMPFQILDEKFVGALSYNRNNNFYDFDRNDTYLNPHIGYLGYGWDITRVDGLHTMEMQWSRFLRQRFGSLSSVTGGLSYRVIDEIMVGVGANIMWGQSDDYQSLVRVGDFLLSNQQRFTFTYRDISQLLTETSKYKATSFNLSTVILLNRVTLGLKIDLPYTLSREWSYTQTDFDSSTTVATFSGTDKFKVPAIFNWGISFQPVDNFTIAFDYEYAPYSKATFELSSNDSSFNKWVNRNTIRLGLEFKAIEFLSFMAGYKSIPQTYIPDGAAIKDKGPDANSYSVGASLNLFFGRIDLAYELRILKYYDSYFSNTNYVFEKSSNILIGYTYAFN